MKTYKIFEIDLTQVGTKYIDSNKKTWEVANNTMRNEKGINISDIYDLGTMLVENFKEVSKW